MLIENASATATSGTFSARTAVDSRDILTVSDELVLESHDTTSLDARLLRAFDQSRRRLSLQLCEHEGLFVGFDVLEFFHVPAAPRTRVRITASVREDRERSTLWSTGQPWPTATSLGLGSCLPAQPGGRSPPRGNRRPYPCTSLPPTTRPDLAVRQRPFPTSDSTEATYDDEPADPAPWVRRRSSGGLRSTRFSLRTASGHTRQPPKGAALTMRSQMTTEPGESRFVASRDGMEADTPPGRA